MKKGFLNIIKLLLITCVMTGCVATSGPDKKSGLSRFKLTDIIGGANLSGRSSRRGIRAIIVSIKDKKGREIFNERDRPTFTYTLDVPEGMYTVTTTCSPASYRYADDKNRYRFKLNTHKVSTKSGDYLLFQPINSRGGCFARLITRNQ